jgi:glutamine cyclotransferase
MVEEKARVVLKKSEFTTLAYYQEEYAARQMTIEAFVAVLLELLNTPEKVTDVSLSRVSYRNSNKIRRMYNVCNKCVLQGLRYMSSPVLETLIGKFVSDLNVMDFSTGQLYSFALESDKFGRSSNGVKDIFMSVHWQYRLFTRAQNRILENCKLSNMIITHNLNKLNYL